MQIDNIRAFEIAVPQVALDDLKARLANARWPEKETVDDWDQGVPLAYAQELAAYWHDHYDWRRIEARLNAHPNFLAAIDGLDIHFLHIRSPNPDARPLILTHGWPGSVLEFLDVIEPLSADYHLVIPSLPGYGFSGKPTEAKWSVEHIAAAWDALMAVLGYPRYFAQGGDWGSAVTCAIGGNHADRCAGIHVNMIVGQPDPATMSDLTDDEKAYLARFGWYRAKDNGYSTQQATRPQTIGYALADSPVGQMCWIVEKCHGWTDCGHQPGGQSIGGHPEKALSRDAMLDTVSLYWLTNSAASSARLYWHSFAQFGFGEVHVPTGCSLFPNEIMRLSRRWAEGRYKNIVYWNTLDKGGHFAAWEQPELFAREVRAAFAAMTL
ncbi:MULTISPECIES: epoxide hydrolase family protein [unclassified Sphingopyxis]|uniref:epoxide hydrolase family protein n=1 Tax=unclassified Sphingopyxis TaxID=2614943 RepID=UPI0007372325|nr:MULTISPECIES: epoxide hydrolase family protein [unclassified Sphingopyxis]KTE46550.1 epoxide hydrolase [Sphingopyxis sp. HIX]KTE85728.1 epoxide hydrolase [Sphingopyxis sp. HXXIV]